MNYKCLGCGVVLQDESKDLLGYSPNVEAKYCERCFRIKNYNEYQKVEKSSEDFYSIIEQINATNDLVVLVVDLMCAGKELNNLVSKLKNKPLLVISKRDAFPYKLNNQKLLDLINFPYIDYVVVSSNRNYNMDLLLEKINEYKKSNNVYIVGLTNSGKSTLINKMIYNYTELDTMITTSMLPSTTLDTIEIKLTDDLTLIDTPGIIDQGSISNYLDNKYLKKLFIKKEIKPITYQIKSKQYILIEDFLKIECEEKCDMTIYMSNALKISRVFKDLPMNLSENEILTKRDCVLVINGLGLIFINLPVKLKIYTIDNVEIYVRSR